MFNKRTAAFIGAAVITLGALAGLAGAAKAPDAANAPRQGGKVTQPQPVVGGGGGGGGAVAGGGGGGRHTGIPGQ